MVNDMDSLILKTIIIGIFLILRKPEHPVEFPIFDLLTFHMGRMFTEQFPDLLHGTAMPANQFHQFPDKFIRLFMLMDIYTSLFRNIKQKRSFLPSHLHPRVFPARFPADAAGDEAFVLLPPARQKVIQRGQGIV